MLCGINPFKVRNKNKYKKLQMITENKIRMLPMFSKESTDLLNQLLVQNVSFFIPYFFVSLNNVWDMEAKGFKISKIMHSSRQLTGISWPKSKYLQFLYRK